MKTVLILALYWFGQIMTLMLVGRAVLSWFAVPGRDTAGKIYKILVDLTEPVVGPCRKFLSKFNTGMFDFSVLLAMLLIEGVVSILVRLVAIIL